MKAKTNIRALSAVIILLICTAFAQETKLKDLKKTMTKWAKHRGTDMERKLKFDEIAKSVNGGDFSGEMKVKSIKLDWKANTAIVKYEYGFTTKGVYVRGKKRALHHKVIVVRRGPMSIAVGLKKEEKSKVLIVVDKVKNCGYALGGGLYGDILLEQTVKE